MKSYFFKFSGRLVFVYLILWKACHWHCGRDLTRWEALSGVELLDTGDVLLGVARLSKEGGGRIYDRCVGYIVIYTLVATRNNLIYRTTASLTADGFSRAAHDTNNMASMLWTNMMKKKTVNVIFVSSLTKWIETPLSKSYDAVWF